MPNRLKTPRSVARNAHLLVTELPLIPVLVTLVASACSFALSPVGGKRPAAPPASPRAGAPDERLDLKVLFLGSSPESEHSNKDVQARMQRWEAFRLFLEQTFVESRVMDRDAFEPAQAEGYDVVLLDWSQQDIAFDEMATLQSPLGPREDWNTPTVLLGSAGLLMATPWQLPGSWG